MATGAILSMLADAKIPEASGYVPLPIGLITVSGFLVTFILLLACPATDQTATQIPSLPAGRHAPVAVATAIAVSVWAWTTSPAQRPAVCERRLRRAAALGVTTDISTSRS
ncbi:hypothetical protein [Streptomyces sp. NPDC058305]|uniref:hypothetical protein n=1 Tax=Streptomyces sp. NPDC058305 TaxID=3346438 RepID=UPI0036E708D8